MPSLMKSSSEGGKRCGVRRMCRAANPSTRCGTGAEGIRPHRYSAERRRTIFRKATHLVTEAEWNKLMDVNVTGMLRSCQSFYEPLVESGRGRVINIASLNSFVSLLEVAPYAASKGAVLSLTRSLAVEWAPAA